MPFKPRVFSGMQPTGNLHLGNYLGALVRWVEMQSTHECIYCIVDMHAITASVLPPDELRKSIREVAAAYVASGIDPNKSILFNQSKVSAHAELAWVFNCIARLGWLDRMTQFKDKAGKDKERASVGLYTYPVLMAADILAYQGTHVPVGDDQKQHVELARDIAGRFNRDYADAIMAAGHADGQLFPLCEPVIMGPATRVMSLRDGTKKMSKSDTSDASRINLTDDPDTIAKKIQKAKTDPLPVPSVGENLKERPEADNLIGIYAALAKTTKEAVQQEHGGQMFGTFKKALVDVAVTRLAPVTAEMRRLTADPAEIDRMLAKNGERAAALAAPVMKTVRQVVGFL
ncbi:MAG: Tryptophan--tRNA ligase [Pseudomonadota bacterium]